MVNNNTYSALRISHLIPLFIISVMIIYSFEYLFLNQISIILFITIITFTVGIPHGALDVILIEKTIFKYKKVKYFFIKKTIIYSIYLSIVIISLLFWVLISELALIIFFLLATYHFQEDWEMLKHPILQFSITITLLSASSWVYSEDLVSLILLLGCESTFTEVFVSIFRLISIFSLFTFFIFFTKVDKSMFDAMSALTVILLAFILPPLFFFVAYFCAFHAVLHTHKIILEYKLNSLSLIYWVSYPMIGTLLIAIIFFLFQDEKTLFSERAFSTTFILLFALTIPHMLLTLCSKYQIHSNLFKKFFVDE